MAARAYMWLQNGAMTGQRYIEQVAGRNYPPTNKNTLIRALIEEWDKLPQQLLDNVVQSMIRRCKRPGSIPLQSNLIMCDTTPIGGVGGWVTLAAHVMGAAIPDVLQSGDL
ncbi:hypothetical protein TNCV_1983791 [Trichonephila clavipes]|nr:hypothetical protein TNCV_1983791 [Trichonephila clavipes]